MTTTDNDVENAFFSLFSTLNKLKTSSAAASDAAATIQSLEGKLEGPIGVIQFLLHRLWLVADDESQNVVQGDNALSVLVHLVESRPTKYMALTSSTVRRDIERNFTTLRVGSYDETSREVSAALIMALAKLLIGPNSDNQVGIATDASASLLTLCRWDRDQNNHCSTIAKRVLSTIDTLWNHLRQQGEQQKRKLSCSQIRISALMIDICLLGGEEMAFSLSKCIMDKLLHIALDHPNDDPLLQVSALDQLERLTVHDDSKYPVTLERADFLLANDILRRGLLCLVGSTGDLSMDANGDEEWGEADPINGGAALRLLTEICRVGVASSVSVSEATRHKFQLLLSSFQKALHHFHPQGELERLSYIHAVSSVVASCAMVASSSSSVAHVANTILSDTTLLHEWLSLHSRVSQPILKSTVLSSLSQVMEPTMWKDEIFLSKNTTRPSDNIVLQLYQDFSHANNERNSAELILASARSPFVEERLGAYNILRALVSRGVCVRLLLLYDDGSGNGTGFLDWLLNQDLECTIEGKKAKYQIVDTMLSQNSDLIGGLLPANALRQLEEWRRKGPHFVNAAQFEMATE
eukprot:CAMPEP_0201876904 /NCGR_PEP_ID=MMETSP0902-20130614/8448_1 /ASSEMBLY_ACC=CAM_ASM_000551 /TAXON_ID=420261 /ORGANISM="Thalassiosira antarctica, Strain CCMP982" /LENGTH=580 /DNA_ID=CAMNT_0048404241 /DNA_START=116 /DNA_END=1858 /DNA_ORIENTATION=-